MKGTTMKNCSTFTQHRLSPKLSQRLVLAIIGAILSAVYTAAPSSAQTYQGFGANTLGGQNGEVYHVTTLEDYNPNASPPEPPIVGSLRHALLEGNRHIKFDVGGVIETKARLRVRGANITIDGLTAPAPGITIRNFGLRLAGNDGAHDVIIRGIRVHIVNNVPGQEDGIAIVAGAHNIVIDHVSVRGASDENIGINNSHDITISWSILAEPLAPRRTNMLITNGANRITLHHNLFFKADRRNPWITWLELVPSSLPPQSPEVVADVRNNLMWEVSNEESSHGIVVFGGAKANVVENVFKATEGVSERAQKRVVVVCKESQVTIEDMEFCGGRTEFPPARAFIANNISGDGFTKHINVKGTETAPFSAPIVDTMGACAAVTQLLTTVGAGGSADHLFQRDQADEQNIAEISLPCPEITSPAPGAVLPGSDVTFTWTGNGAEVIEWQLYVGSQRGGKDLHASENMQPSRNTRTVRKLPTDGRPLWVQLRFRIGGVWQFVDYRYTAATR
jgi:hypothetical protein